MKYPAPSPEEQHRSRFDELMELFEYNYILIRRLLGDLRRLQKGDEFPLRLHIQARVVDRGPFTLTLLFTDHQVLTDDGLPATMTVRVYLDARTAEMFGPQDRANCLTHQKSHCVALQRKRNQFLERWLLTLIATK